MSFIFNFARLVANITPPFMVDDEGTRDGCTYDSESDDFSIAVYRIILPSVCCAGLIGNLLSFLVLMNLPCKCSSYTYLASRTAADTINCLLLLLSVVAHGFFRNVDGEDFDLLITLPLASIFNGISVCATVGVTLDRCMYLWDPTSPVRPSYCSPYIARRIMAITTLFSILFNLPYFFIFVLQSDGNLHATKFFKSRIYYVYNWLRLIIFGIIPCVILIIVTAILIHCIRKVAHTLRHLCVTRKKELLDPTRMSWTLITMVVLFIVGEIPNLIFSRKAAFVFLYSGDPNMINEDDSFQDYRQVALVLGAVNCSCNFMVFYMLHPPFGKGLKSLFSRKKKEPKQQQVLINVYLISDKLEEKTKNQIAWYEFDKVKNYSSKSQVFTTWVSR